MNAMSRRQLLSLGALTAASIPLGGPVASALCNYQKSAPPRSRSVRTAASETAPQAAAVAPFSVVAHSNLSEDYFLTDDVLVDPLHDSVLPVILDNGTLVRVIVSPDEQTVSMLAPDPTEPSGFTVTQLDQLNPYFAGGSGGDMAAANWNGYIDVLYTAESGAGSGRDALWAAHVRPDGTDAGSYWFSPPLTYRSDGHGTSTPPRIVVDPDGIPHTAAVNLSGAGTLYFGQPPGPSQPGIPLNGMPPRTDVQFALSGPATNRTIAVVALTSDTNCCPSNLTIAVGPVNQPGDDPPGMTVHAVQFPPGQSPATAILAQPLADPVPSQPSAAVAISWRDSDGGAWAALVTASGQLVGKPVQFLSEANFQLQAGNVISAGWLQAPNKGKITAYLLAGDGPSTVYTQMLDFTQAQPDAAPIPLQAGVTAMYLPVQGLTENTDITIASPSTDAPNLAALATLTRTGPTGVWASSPIHCGKPAYQNPPGLDTYRTMVTVVDANGVPVPNTNVYITPELEVLAFRTTGGVPLPAGQETTVQTDDWGQICIAALATALQASSYSIRCDTALPGGSAPAQRTIPITVAPDEEMHNFLAGNAPLNKYATVTQLITDPSTTVFSKISGDSQSVAAVASAVNAAVTAGLNPTNAPKAGAPTVHQLADLDTAKPSYSAHFSPLPQASFRSEATTPAWFKDLENDIKSVWKAIEQDIAKVAKVVQGWDADAKQWFVELTLSIDGYVGGALRYVIDGVKSAIAAVHGILQSIGADIESVIKLIRTLVSDIMKDTESIADTLYSWISYDPANPGNAGLAVARGKVDDLLNEAKSATNGFFGGAEKDLTTQIQNLSDTAGSYTPNKSKAEGTAHTPPSHAAATSTSHNSRTTWLLEKSRSTPVSSSISPASAVSAGTAAIATTIGAKTAPTASAKSAAGKLPSAEELLENFDMATLTAMLLEVMVDGLKFLDDIVIDILTAMEGAVDDLSAAVRMPLSDVPIIDLLATVFSIDIENFTIGKLLCLVLGFGIAVVGDLVYGGNSWLPKPVGSSLAPRTHALGTGPSLRTQQPSWEIFVDLSNTVVYAFSIIPTVADAAAALAVPAEPPPLILQIIDMVFGVVENALAFPFGTPPDSGSVLAWDARQTDANKFFGAATPIYSWILGFVPLAVQIIAAVMSEKKGAGTASTEEEAFLETGQLVLLSAIGVVNLAIDIAVTALSETGTEDILLGVLLDVFGWAPTALSFLLLDAAAPEGPPGWAIIAVFAPIVVVGCEIAEMAAL